MKKFFYFLAAALVAAPLCLSLTACGSDDDNDNNNNRQEVSSNSIVGSWKFLYSSDEEAPVGAVFTFNSDGSMTTTFDEWKKYKMTYTYNDTKLTMSIEGKQIMEAVIVVQGNKATGTFVRKNKTYTVSLERQ